MIPLLQHFVVEGFCVNMKSKYIFWIAIFILVFIFVGCGEAPEQTTGQTQGESNPPSSALPTVESTIESTPEPQATPSESTSEDTSTNETVPDPVPTPEPVKFSIPMPSADGTNIFENEKVLIDYSNCNFGYIMVNFLEETTRGLMARLSLPAGGTHNFRLRSGEFVVIPLTHGNGKYKIEIFQSAGGNAYAEVLSETISVELIDEFAAFLRPNYYVNYHDGNEAIKYAWEMTKGLPEELDKVAAVYTYVIENVKYDMAFAESVSGGGQGGYVPDIDRVLRENTGICFDYAVLMTAMLRSQGVPTRLVFGFVGTVYHAWINVYTKDSGWVNGVIFFTGSEWVLMDPTFASALLDDNNTLDQFIGDGSNYDVRFTF